MLWKVIPDRKNSEYDMFCCAIVKADNKDEAELRKFSRPFKEDEYNYFIQIHPSHNNIVTESDDYCQTQGTIYFESTAIANEAIDAIGENRIKKYIFGVEE